MAEVLTKAKFLAPIDRGRVAADWHQRGFSCELFVDPPGRAWLDFVHATDELVTVVEGRLELSVGGETVVAEAGDEVMIRRGVRHSVRNIHSRETRWLYGYRHDISASES